MDDRKAKSVRDQIEREQRVGRAEAVERRATREAEKAAREAALAAEVVMPGSGHTIGDVDDLPKEEMSVEDMEGEVEDPVESGNH